jgi:uncharacterized repeat protein (TIGR03803 family)
VSPTDGKPPIVIYNFDNVHGAGPQGGLTQVSVNGSSVFYGTTYSGGKYGVGTVFKITADGNLTDMWDFRNGTVIPYTPKPTDQQKLDAAGAYPIAPPVELGGTLYGVTTYAGNLPRGVLYKIDGGGYQGLYQFKPADAAAKGAFPVSLSKGRGGAICGVTAKGGLGWGTIFQVAGGGITTLYKFTADTMGSAGVIEADDGSIYGTAQGPNTRQGLIYKLNPVSQQFTIIYPKKDATGQIPASGNWPGIGPGADPAAELIQSSDGMLYGVTHIGGQVGRGAFFRVDTNGDNFTTLFNLDMNDGRYAVSPMIELSKDNFYGITDEGGDKGQGVFYHLTVNMYPKPAQNPTYYVGGEPAASYASITDTAFASPSTATVKPVDFDVLVRKDEGSYQVVPQPDGTTKASDLSVGGIQVTLVCPRDPHIVQFVSRMQINPDGTDQSGLFATSWAQNLPFTTNPGSPQWITDSDAVPNAYYDQAKNASHSVTTNQVNIFDAPQPFGSTDEKKVFHPVPAGWQVGGEDYCICNCKVVSIVHWTRGARYDPKTGLPGPSEYSNISIEKPKTPADAEEWSETQMIVVNQRLTKDEAHMYDPVP